MRRGARLTQACGGTKEFRMDAGGMPAGINGPIRSETDGPQDEQENRSRLIGITPRHQSFRPD